MFEYSKIHVVPAQMPEGGYLAYVTSGTPGFVQAWGSTEDLARGALAEKYEVAVTAALLGEKVKKNGWKWPWSRLSAKAK